MSKEREIEREKKKIKRDVLSAYTILSLYKYLFYFIQSDFINCLCSFSRSAGVFMNFLYNKLILPLLCKFKYLKN